MNAMTTMPRWVMFAVLASITSASAARATTLTVDTGKSLSLAPAETGTLTLSVANDAGAIDGNFGGWVLGLQLVPSGSTSGTVSFGPLTNAALNPAIVASPGDLEFLNEVVNFPVGVTINGRGSYQSLAIIDNGEANTLAGLASYNLGDLQLTASGDAEGTWNIFAVNLPNADGNRSYWFTADFNQVAFGNVAVPTNGGTTSVLIGTVTAVPEPGSLTLAAIGAAVAMGAAVRRRIRRAA